MPNADTRNAIFCCDAVRQLRLVATVHSQSMKPLSMNLISLIHFVINICYTRTTKIDYTAKFHFAARRYEGFFSIFPLSAGKQAWKKKCSSRRNRSGFITYIFCRTSSYFHRSFELCVLRQFSTMSQLHAKFIWCIEMLGLVNLMHADEVVGIYSNKYWLIQCLFFCDFRSMWDALLKSVRCEIISFKRNDEIDAYVLRWVEWECVKFSVTGKCASFAQKSCVRSFVWLMGFLLGRGKNDARRAKFFSHHSYCDHSVSQFVQIIYTYTHWARQFPRDAK